MGLIQRGSAWDRSLLTSLHTGCIVCAETSFIWSSGPLSANAVLAMNVFEMLLEPHPDGESPITKTMWNLRQCPPKIESHLLPCFLSSWMQAVPDQRSLQQPGYACATCGPSLSGCFCEAHAKILLLGVLFACFNWCWGEKKDQN